jgi:hypothetical protein
VVLQTKELDICDGQYVEITDDIWENIVAHITSLEVAVLPQKHVELVPRGILRAGGSSSAAEKQNCELGMTV